MSTTTEQKQLTPTEQALNLIKQAATMISADFDARVQLIAAVQHIQKELARIPALETQLSPKPETAAIEGEHGPGA